MDIIDSKDVGTVEGFDIRAVIVDDGDSSPDDADCYTAKEKAAWRNGDWQYVGTIVTASKAGVELGSASLWGSEYGSLPSVREFVNPLSGDGEDFVNGYGRQLIAEAIAEAKTTLTKLGVTP